MKEKNAAAKEAPTGEPHQKTPSDSKVLGYTNRNGNTSVPSSIILNTNISTGARLLYVVLKSFTDNQFTVPFPNKKLLMKLTGFGRSTLLKYQNELHALDLLNWTQTSNSKGSSPKQYTLKVPRTVEDCRPKICHQVQHNRKR